MSRSPSWLLVALLLALPLGLVGDTHETTRNVTTLGGLQGIRIDAPVSTYPTTTTEPPTTTTAAPTMTVPDRTTTTKPSRSYVRPEPSTTTTVSEPTTTVPPEPEVEAAADTSPDTTDTTAEPAQPEESPWSTAQASYYGPGLYGNKTACGQVLSPSTEGVAHKTLPCGSRVTFRHNGVVVATTVIDRGPYVKGRMWDLSNGLCQKLQHCSTGPIEYRIG